MAELVVGYASSDARGLIKMIMAAVQTARRNKKQCQELEHRVKMVYGVLQQHRPEAEQPCPEMMRRPGAREAVDGLHGVLREAHELAVSFQSKKRRSARPWAVLRRVLGARSDAEKLADVLSKIDFYLSLYPVAAHSDMACRLDRLLWATTMSVIVSAVAFAGFLVVSMATRKK